ncbi:MAG: N-acetyltransferase [Alcaligenaceae bacterium]|nr:MAG: N-acetyltransferase [Alcaligenaceae bacterium]
MNKIENVASACSVAVSKGTPADRPGMESPVQLTPLERSDGPELFALTHANREQLRVWLPWVDDILAPENTQAFVDDALEQDLAGKQKHFLLRTNDAIIGTISLVNIGQGQGTVGYWIAPAYQGRGYVTQGVLELKTIAFEKMGLDCLHLEYLEGNGASARVAAKCGFTLDRVIERDALLHGRELDRMCCIARKPAPRP